MAEISLLAAASRPRGAELLGDKRAGRSYWRQHTLKVEDGRLFRGSRAGIYRPAAMRDPVPALKD